MSLYPTARNIHLALGLFAAAGLLLYGVSAVRMTHRSWFPAPASSTEAEALLPPHLENGRALAELLMQRHLVRGELDSITPSASGLRLAVKTTSTSYDCAYDASTGLVRIRTIRQPLLGVLSQMHHAAGLWHATWALQLWNVFVLLLSLALLGVGCSGVYLWFRRQQDRLLGLILLGVNLGVSGTLLLLIRGK